MKQEGWMVRDEWLKARDQYCNAGGERRGEKEREIELVILYSTTVE